MRNGGGLSCLRYLPHFSLSLFVRARTLLSLDASCFLANSSSLPGTLSLLLPLHERSLFGDFEFLCCVVLCCVLFVVRCVLTFFFCEGGLVGW